MADLVRKNGVEKVILDNELKSIQTYNLTKMTGVETIDRFQLILEIFARRASTKEAKLQIELAKLRYELPRAKEKVKLARKGEQPGFMGLGKYEVDRYYETIKRRISNTRKKLIKVRKRKGLHRTHRIERGFSVVSLAGYTNAGKSTLFNALAKEAVPVGTGLFTTLSTTTRATNLFGKQVLIIDTVGFIDRLPITLIEAFQSTLEETIFSDLILLVVDINEHHEETERKLNCCLDTIKRIGANGIPIVTALNKTDMLTKNGMEQKIKRLEDVAPNSIPVSALYKTNISSLKEAIVGHLKGFIQASVTLPLTDESISFLSGLLSRCSIINVQYQGKNVSVVFESVPWFANKVRCQVKQFGGRFITLKD